MERGKVEEPDEAYKWLGIASEEEMEEQHHRQVLLEAQEGANEQNIHKLIKVLQTSNEVDGKRDMTMKRILNRTEEMENQIQELWTLRITRGVTKEMAQSRADIGRTRY